MFVYFVMRTQRLHAPTCECFNAQYEHVRVHVLGVFISKAKAKEEALKRSTEKVKCFVQSYKIKDPESFKIPMGLGVMTPLLMTPISLLDPCRHCKGPCGNVACPKLLRVT